MTNLANEQALAQQPTPIPETVIKILRRPLPPEAIKPHPTKKFLSTIKAIYVVERLNEAFGLNGWKVRNELVELHETTIQTKDGHEKLITMVVMKSFLTVPEYGIEVEAYGGNDNEDRGDAYKGACTDALTKICSYIYVGMDVYKGIKSTPIVNAAGEITGGSQAAADEMLKGKLTAIAAGASPRDVSNVLQDVAIATPSEVISAPLDAPKPKKSKAYRNLMDAFDDILTRFTALHLEDIYYDHLHKAKVNHCDQFTDDEDGFNAARKCFKHMAAELSELEVAAKKATE